MRALAPRCVLLAALSAAVIPALAGAQWTTVSDAPPGATGEVPVALVENDTGDTLRVFLDAEARVRAQFEVGDPLSELAPDTCPTYLVDDGAPSAARYGDDRCLMGGGAAMFSLGAVDRDAVASEALLALMNGKVVTVRYRLAGAGYREARFSLRGSKQALNEAIGSRVRVVAE